MSDLHDFHNWILSRWQDAEIKLQQLPEYRREKGKGLCLQGEIESLYTVDGNIEEFYKAFPEKDKRGIGVVDPDGDKV